MKKGKQMSQQVVKDNVLINASYSLDLVEQRIILQGIVKSRDTEQGFNALNPVRIHASEYEKLYAVTKDGAYKALKDAVLSLFERQFSFTELQDEKLKVVKSRWVSQIAYVDDLAEIQIIFSPAVSSMCSRLERHFTSYDLEQVAPLTSKYAVRLYELMMSWKAVGKTPVIKLQDFREKIGLLDESEYKDMCTFKKYVLDLAVAQINEHTDIKLDYEQHKSGRKIDGFSFKFKQKVKQQKKKTEAETPKKGDSSPRIEKPSQIPVNIVKQPENAQKDGLGHRASKITGLIMSNGLADRFKRSDESVMDMMKRIKEEITTDATADQWQSKLEEFGVVF